MKLTQYLSLASGISVALGLASAFYYGQSEQPYHYKSVKFCPETANKINRERSQERLDKKYCSYEYKLLAEVWNHKRFNENKPITNSFLIVKDIYPSNNSIWFLLAPVFAGIGYLCYAKKSELNELSAHQELESYKTWLKIETQSQKTNRAVNIRDFTNERDFKGEIIDRKWNTARIQNGLISIEALQRQQQQQQDLQDSHHAIVLSQNEAYKAQFSKLKHENIRDSLKAEKEAQRYKTLLNSLNDEYSQASTPEALKNSLIDAMKKHEDGWLWRVINSLKPMWLIGNQGSGKTYTAAAIALVRKYCLDVPIYQLIDRHATGDNAEVWKFLEAASKAESEDEIEQAFIDTCERWLTRIKQKVAKKQQVIVDEFTNLKTLCGESAIQFFKMSLTDTRKAKEYLLGITHNATNESFPDGTSAARKAGTILIEKFSANGETPLSRVVIRHGIVDEKGNNLEDEERTMPDWLHPELIYNHFNGKPINLG